MNKSSYYSKLLADQSGRSMVEMMGVLAVTGIITIGSIGAYTYAMNKHRTNELIYEATKRAQSVSTQLLTGHEPNLDEFTETVFGGGEFGDIVLFEGDGVFGVQIRKVRRGVCENLIDSMGDSTVLRGVTDLDGINSIRTCEEENDLALLFDRNLELGDDFGDGEANGSSNPRPKVDAACSNHGRFTGTSCACQSGWGDTDCSKRCVHGLWKNDKCECNTGWCGSDCTNVAAPEAVEPEEPEVSTTMISGGSQNNPTGCNGHGTWIVQSDHPAGGYCDCERGYTGENCESRVSVVSPSTGEQTITPEVTVTNFSCGEHGSRRVVSVFNGAKEICDCDSGWGGSDCSEDHRNDCGEHGNWYQSENNGAGGCGCDLNWGGSDCSEDHTNDCSGHGFWCGGRCTCDSGWGGSDCSEDHTNDCSGHGYWNSGAGGCSCNTGWGGDDCSISTSCSGHGTRSGSSCTCDSGWGGSDCSINTSCSGHGTWNGSSCTCDSGWGGSDCSDGSARESCSNHGYLNGTMCTCDSGWSGDDCSTCQPTCTWTEWFDVDYPKYEEGGGDFETYEKVRAAGGAVCAQPQEIQCEAESWPGLPLEQVGQRVLCDVRVGLVCRNEEQPGQFKMCVNYRMRVLCCDNNCTTPTSP